MAESKIVINSGDILSPTALLSHGRIFAGPGAGKTHFLVENVKNIVQTKLSKSNDVQKVLCITYTNAAVNEISNRLDSFDSACEVSTIHSFVIQNLITPFQADLRAIMKEDFSIDIHTKKLITSQAEGVGILHGVDKKDISQYVNNDLKLSETIPVEGFSKKVLGDIEVDVSPFFHSNEGFLTKCKIKHSEKIDEKVALSVKKYTWSIVRKLTHDEVLYFGWRILQRNAIALLSIRTKFPYIFVDEFQDTSPIQTKIIELIGERISTVFVVGDVCQSIYSFQGAKSSDFQGFRIDGQKKLLDYEIRGNRRSTANVVNFCNLIRQEDGLVQKSERPYKTKEEGDRCESEKIHLLVGDSVQVKNLISELHKNGAVVLTRTWAASFQYIDGISEDQATLLKNIYNSYFNSPIDIHAEIVEQNNVPWVRAFRCIIGLWKAYECSSFFDLLKAFKFYVDLIPTKFTPKNVFLFMHLLQGVFSEVSSAITTIALIDSFNAKLKEEVFSPLLIEGLLGPNFQIIAFDDGASENEKGLISQLEFKTSQKLFNEVFSVDSTYMTVHQAKGLEWDNVIVSVSPTRKDGITLTSFFSNPKLVGDAQEKEFGRIFYVACSRARTGLFIRIKDEGELTALQSSLNRLSIPIPFDIIC